MPYFHQILRQATVWDVSRNLTSRSSNALSLDFVIYSSSHPSQRGFQWEMEVTAFPTALPTVP